MSENVSLFPIAAVGLIGFGMVAALFLAPDLASADDRLPPPAHLIEVMDQVPVLQSVEPAAGLSGAAMFNEYDRRAALESVQFALTEVADGASYVWKRTHGRLSGVVQPTSSFKDSSGTVCRHVIVMLTSTERSSKTETIACRGGDGIWQLSG